MISINLIPCRSELKKRRQYLHIILTALILFCITIFLFMGQMFIKQQLDILLIGNNNLERKFVILKAQHLELQKLRITQQILLQKTQKLNVLMAERLFITRFLIVLSKIMPNTVYLTDLKVKANNIQIHGRSLQAIGYTALLTEIRQSTYLQNPSIISIKKAHDDFDDFILTCERKSS